MAKVGKKERYINRTPGLQIVYDEAGNKREIVPRGSIFMTPEWAKRFKCLRRADKMGTEATGKEKVVVSETPAE